MREIEAKFIVPSELAKPELDHILRSILPALKEEHCGKSSDYYYQGSVADFVRLRVDDYGFVDFCAKLADEADNFDRLEVELFLGKDDVDGRTTRQFARLAFGPEITKLRKTYTNFEMDSGVVVSTCTMEGFDHVIMEIEGRTAADVWGVVHHIRDELAKLPQAIKLRPEPRSIFQMFVQPLLKVPT